MNCHENSTSFVALDFETANPDIASICQIGAVTFEGGTIRESWNVLVNPEGSFDPFNISVHGITEAMVRTAPTFPQVFAELRQRLSDRIVISHTTFDKTALTEAIRRYGLSKISCTWLDSTRIVRRTWPQFARRGYGLKNMAQWLGIEFNHHDAVEDARAAGIIVLHAIAETRRTLEEWIEHLRQPCICPYSAEVICPGNPDGPLSREVLVFTGKLSIARSSAIELAAAAGCDVAASLSLRTTILVVGKQAVRSSSVGPSKKQRQAEALIAQGCAVRIINEEEFFRMVIPEPGTVKSKKLGVRNDRIT
nr:transposase [Deltaproteobacteria bacterium]